MEPPSFSCVTMAAFSSDSSTRAPAATRRASWSWAKPKMSAPPSTSVIMLVAASPSPTGSTIAVIPAYSGWAALNSSILALVRSTIASATQIFTSPEKPSADAVKLASERISARDKTTANNLFMVSSFYLSACTLIMCEKRLKTFSDANIIASFCPFVYLNLSSGGFFGQFEIIDLAPGSRSLTPYIYTRCQQVSVLYPDPLNHRGIPAVID